MSVNAKTVFELDEIFFQLRLQAFKSNNISFFRNFQKLIEESAELPGYKFFPEIIFREGNMLYPQRHEYSFSNLLRRNKEKVVSFGIALRIRRLDIPVVNMGNISTVVMTEEELLGALYCLLKKESPVALDEEKYFYLYSVSTDGKIFSQVWINWKGTYWSIKSSEGSSAIQHKFGGVDVLLVV